MSSAELVWAHDTPEGVADVGEVRLSEYAVAIVGHGADKFTEAGEARARAVIRALLLGATSMVSGHSPVGGIDIWAEEEARRAGIALDLKEPTALAWDPPGGYGFKARNQDIARTGAACHVILADSYPPGYKGRRFATCYHCARIDRATPEHPKSGGCWTGAYALRLGKPAIWHVVANAP